MTTPHTIALIQVGKRRHLRIWGTGDIVRLGAVVKDDNGDLRQTGVSVAVHAADLGPLIEALEEARAAYAVVSMSERGRQRAKLGPAPKAGSAEWFAAYRAAAGSPGHQWADEF